MNNINIRQKEFNSSEPLNFFYAKRKSFNLKSKLFVFNLTKKITKRLNNPQSSLYTIAPLTQSSFKKFKKILSLNSINNLNEVGSEQKFYTSYSKLAEIKLITLDLPTKNTIKRWAQKFPNKKMVGKVMNANTLHHKTFKPQKGGLFCEKIFGPLKDFTCACGKLSNATQYKAELKTPILPNLESKKENTINSLKVNDKLVPIKFCPDCDVEYTWSVIRRYQLGYIELESPITHVWYLKGSPSYLSILLNMPKKNLEYITYCSETLTLENLIKKSAHSGIGSTPNEIFSSWKKLMTPKLEVKSLNIDGPNNLGSSESYKSKKLFRHELQIQKRKEIKPNQKTQWLNFYFSSKDTKLTNHLKVQTSLIKSTVLGNSMFNRTQKKFKNTKLFLIKLAGLYWKWLMLNKKNKNETFVQKFRKNKTIFQDGSNLVKSSLKNVPIPFYILLNSEFLFNITNIQTSSDIDELIKISPNYNEIFRNFLSRKDLSRKKIYKKILSRTINKKIDICSKLVSAGKNNKINSITNQTYIKDFSISGLSWPQFINQYKASFLNNLNINNFPKNNLTHTENDAKIVSQKTLILKVFLILNDYFLNKSNKDKSLYDSKIITSFNQKEKLNKETAWFKELTPFVENKFLYISSVSLSIFSSTMIQQLVSACLPNKYKSFHESKVFSQLIEKCSAQLVKPLIQSKVVSLNESELNCTNLRFKTMKANFKDKLDEVKNPVSRTFDNLKKMLDLILKISKNYSFSLKISNFNENKTENKVELFSPKNEFNLTKKTLVNKLERLIELIKRYQEIFSYPDYQNLMNVPDFLTLMVFFIFLKQLVWNIKINTDFQIDNFNILDFRTFNLFIFTLATQILTNKYIGNFKPLQLVPPWEGRLNSEVNLSTLNPYIQILVNQIERKKSFQSLKVQGFRTSNLFIIIQKINKKSESDFTDHIPIKSQPDFLKWSRFTETLVLDINPKVKPFIINKNIEKLASSRNFIKPQSLNQLGFKLYKPSNTLTSLKKHFTNRGLYDFFYRLKEISLFFKETVLKNNIYNLSYRELWGDEINWDYFCFYNIPQTNSLDIPIASYKYRLWDLDTENFSLKKDSKKLNLETKKIQDYVKRYPAKFPEDMQFSYQEIPLFLTEKEKKIKIKKGKPLYLIIDKRQKNKDPRTYVSEDSIRTSDNSLKKLLRQRRAQRNSWFSGPGLLRLLLEEFDNPTVQEKLILQTRSLLIWLNITIRELIEETLPLLVMLAKDEYASFQAGTGDSTVKLQSFPEEKRVRALLNKLWKNRIQLVRFKKLLDTIYIQKTYPSAMSLIVLPVLPPDLRPIVKIGGQIAASDLNRLYQRVIYRNDYLKKFLNDPATSNSYMTKYSQRLLQEAVDNLISNGKSGVTPEKDSRGRLLKSLSDILKGKQGRFRQYLLGKRVDYSGRSVIVVGPNLKIHECGIPKEMAFELYLPFLLKTILNQNLARTVIGAKTLIKKKPSLAWELLREIMQTCPVLLNRAPTLHRLGIQAFQPKLIEGKAILLHPLVCSAFNADFDGDQMAVHIPITVEARAEAWKLMLSRNNLLSPATGEPLVIPSQDMVLGCYYLTTNCNEKNIKHQKGSGSYFNSFTDVVKNYENKRLDLHSIIWVQWNDWIENGNDNEEPLEIRINSYGYYSEIYSKSQKHYDNKKSFINQYVSTTPGKVLFNVMIQTSKKNYVTKTLNFN